MPPETNRLITATHTEKQKRKFDPSIGKTETPTTGVLFMREGFRADYIKDLKRILEDLSPEEIDKVKDIVRSVGKRVMNPHEQVGIFAELITSCNTNVRFKHFIFDIILSIIKKSSENHEFYFNDLFKIYESRYLTSEEIKMFDRKITKIIDYLKTKDVELSKPFRIIYLTHHYNVSEDRSALEELLELSENMMKTKNLGLPEFYKILNVSEKLESNTKKEFVELIERYIEQLIIGEHFDILGQMLNEPLFKRKLLGVLTDKTIVLMFKAFEDKYANLVRNDEEDRYLRIIFILLNSSRTKDISNIRKKMAKYTDNIFTFR
ncbi:hypothetical protein KO465_05555 [Candidatus Micrarchaeota archaeon]|nr:hypothetical protein [Candidatus Micrarchaeota archaeon]